MQVGEIDFRQAAAGLREVDDAGDQAVLADQQIGEMKVAVDEAAALDGRDGRESRGQGGAEAAVGWAGRRQAVQQRLHAVIEPGRGIAERRGSFPVQYRNGLAKAAGEAVAFAVRQPRQPFFAEGRSGHARDPHPAGIALRRRARACRKGRLGNQPRHGQMAKRPSAERGEHARLVGMDIEPGADAGVMTHELQQRAVAEIEGGPPEAMAEHADPIYRQVRNSAAQPIQ